MMKNRLLFVLIVCTLAWGGVWLWQKDRFREAGTPERKELVIVKEVASDVIVSVSERVEVPKPAVPRPPSFIISDVPFTAQAPFGQWQNPIFQDACEEASIIMAVAWAREDRLTADGVTDTIGTLASWQKKVFGHSVDTSITDTARMLREYYGMTGAVPTGVTIEDIKRVLASDHLVIVPTDGRKLKNPNFTAPGPPRHMLVVVGYDDVAGEFIVNDPGTRRGEGYRYSEATLYDAILDYPTGRHAEVTSTDKVMLTVSKEKF